MPRQSAAARFTDQDYLEGAATVSSLRMLALSFGLNFSTMHRELERRGILEDVKGLTGTKGRNDGGKATRRLTIPRNVPPDGFTRRSNPHHDTLESQGQSIRTLDGLLKAAEVDLSTWAVRDYVVNSWQQHSVESGVVQLFQVKAKLERIREAVDLTVLRDAAVEAMRAHSPLPVKRYRITERSDLAMEVLVPDLHLGAMAHAEETGHNYDGKIAVAAFRHTVSGLLAQAQSLRVARIIFVAGSDLLHVDGEDAATTAGTPQDTDGRFHRSVRRAIRLMVEAIDSMLQIAPTDVVVVPGNHSRAHEFMLGEVIRAWYRNEEGLTIHDSPAPRKYLKHGTTLLGYCHGDSVKDKDLPLIMATEAPLMWAETAHRTWSVGHLHQRRSQKFGSVLEDKGVEVRISPSLKPADSWHGSHGYIGNLRAAEAYCHSATEGEVARFRAVLPPDFGNDKRSAA